MEVFNIILRKDEVVLDPLPESDQHQHVTTSTCNLLPIPTKYGRHPPTCS